MVKWVKISKAEIALEIQLIRPTEVCGEVKSELIAKSLLRIDKGSQGGIRC